MTLSDYFASLGRHWKLVLVCAVIGALVAFGISKLQSPQYRAKSSLALAPAGSLEDESRVAQALDALTKRSLVATFVEIVDSKASLRSAGAQLGMSRKQIDLYTVKAVALPDANVVEASVSGPNPATATRLLTALDGQASDSFQNLYRTYVVQPIEAPRRPPGPFSPQPLRNAAFGLLLGAIIGFVIGLIRDRAAHRFEVLPPAPAGALSAPQPAHLPPQASIGPGSANQVAQVVAALMPLFDNGQQDEPAASPRVARPDATPASSNPVPQAESAARQGIVDDDGSASSETSVRPPAPWTTRVGRFLLDAARRSVHERTAPRSADEHAGPPDTKP